MHFVEGKETDAVLKRLRDIELTVRLGVCVTREAGQAKVVLSPLSVMRV